MSVLRVCASVLVGFVLTACSWRWPPPGEDSALPVFDLGPVTGTPACVVIGQPDFTSGAANQGGAPSPNSLMLPGQTLVVGGKLLIADQANNRVLIFNRIPTANNPSADVVIGQPDFVSSTNNQRPSPTSPDTVDSNTLDRPAGLASDGQRLFLLDRDNHRVLIYNQIPTANNAAADIVLGHDTMTDGSSCGESVFNNTRGLGASCLSTGPGGLAYDAESGKLIIYDNDNDRVLIYDRVPTHNGAAADVVVGQPDFVHNATNQGGAVGPTTLDLNTGSGVGTYKGKLLIADRMNNRVLIFNSIPTSNNASADVVIGQPNFTQNSPNQGGTVSAQGLDGPRGAQVDDKGRLYVPDAWNARVLVYDQIPTTNNAAADVVIGQPNFTTAAPGTTDRTLQIFPYHVSFFPGHFIVTDGTNHRVLIFRMRPRFAWPAFPRDASWDVAHGGGSSDEHDSEPH
jgi:hypothetical protein